MDDFRTALNDELSELAEPPLGDLVATVARQRRRRRRRAVAAAAGSAAAVAIVAALLSGLLGTGMPQQLALPGASPASATPAPDPVLGVDAAPPHSAVGSSSSATVIPAPNTAVPTTMTAAAPTGTPVATTGPALLAALLKALPPTEYASNFAANSGDSPMVQALLSRGTIRLSLGSAAGRPACAAPDQCFRDSRGQQVTIINSPSNCYQETVIVDHPDGTAVQLDQHYCLPGSADPNRGSYALSQDQAVALAGDPAFSRQMDSGFVQAAAARFPHLPPIA